MKKPVRSLEFVSEKVVYRLDRLESWYATCVFCLQAITAFRPKIPSESKASFLYSALRQISKKYDFDLLTYDTNSVNCSELLYGACRAIGIDLDGPSKIVNRKILVPTDIVKYFIEKGVPEHQFSFLFFVEKKECSVIERSAEDLS